MASSKDAIFEKARILSESSKSERSKKRAIAQLPFIRKTAGAIISLPGGSDAVVPKSDGLNECWR